jgi:hypothetical protein
MDNYVKEEIRGVMDMKSKSIFSKLLVLFCVVLLFSSCSKATDADATEEHVLKNSVLEVMRQVDSPDFASQVSNDEFIVKAYLFVNARKPDAFEFYYCRALFTQNRLTRSNLLALLLAGAANEIGWDQCRTLLKRNPVNYLKEIKDIRQDVRNLQNTPRAKIIEHYQQHAGLNQSQNNFQAGPGVVSTAVSGADSGKSAAGEPVANESYNTYFGYLHAHTGYSDGTGTPDKAYQYARISGKLDFFAVTDHGEMLIIWPWQKKWLKIKEAADAHYLPGVYVTLWGFEWSNPLLGHVNIINTGDCTNCLARAGLGGIYNWLEARPDGFAIYNHPGDYDFLSAEFGHLAMTEAEAVPQMVGIETWNGGNSFDRYYYRNTWKDCNYSYMDTGNRNGWRLGALGAQDNHGRDWGAKNQFRTAVLAKELTREEIVAAYRNRRFYATEDNNLYLDFRCSGYPMGSQLTGVARAFTVTAADQSDDTFKQIRLYRNGDLIAAQSVTGSSVSVSFTDHETTAAAYYYVIVTENDDNDANGRNDEAISAPIWIQ